MKNAANASKADAFSQSSFNKTSFLSSNVVVGRLDKLFAAAIALMILFAVVSMVVILYINTEALRAV